MGDDGKGGIVELLDWEEELIHRCRADVTYKSKFARLLIEF